MYIKEPSTPTAIDAIGCAAVNVQFGVPGSFESAIVQLTMFYMNRTSGATYGTCPVSLPMLSQETLAHLASFIEGAEQDFGKLVFSDGRTDTPADRDSGQPEQKGLAWRG